MTKRELIDEITHLNTSASPAFLAAFEDEDLSAYLQRLQRVTDVEPAVEAAPASAAAKGRRKKQLQPAVA